MRPNRHHDSALHRHHEARWGTVGEADPERWATDGRTNPGSDPPAENDPAEVEGLLSRLARAAALAVEGFDWPDDSPVIDCGSRPRRSKLVEYARAYLASEAFDLTLSQMVKTLGFSTRKTASVYRRRGREIVRVARDRLKNEE